MVRAEIAWRIDGHFVSAVIDCICISVFPLVSWAPRWRSALYNRQPVWGLLWWSEVGTHLWDGMYVLRRFHMFLIHVRGLRVLGGGLGGG